MTQSIHIGVHIAVTATATGMGGVALLRAGGIGYHIHIAMTCRNNHAVVIVNHLGCFRILEPQTATSADVVSNVAILLAGCFFRIVQRRIMYFAHKDGLDGNISGGILNRYFPSFSRYSTGMSLPSASVTVKVSSP